MTYGELKAMMFGWVMAHVVDDMCSNARFECGTGWRDEQVSEYDLRTIREKAIHFKESLPVAFADRVAA